VLIIDDAHHLCNEVLEDLRLLTNYAMNTEQRPGLLPVGLAELPALEYGGARIARAQRIVVRYHLSGLSREKLTGCLVDRLKVAAGMLPLFELLAIEASFHDTAGRPRRFNVASHFALSASALSRSQ